MINDIFHLLTFQEFIKKLEKMFSIEKNRILHPLQILYIRQYHRSFDLRKGPANTPMIIMQISTQTDKPKVQKNVATKKSKLFKKMGLQGFIQAPTDLRLPEVKTQS